MMRAGAAAAAQAERERDDARAQLAECERTIVSLTRQRDELAMLAAPKPEPQTERDECLVLASDVRSPMDRMTKIPIMRLAVAELCRRELARSR